MKPHGRRLPAWLSARADAYTRVVTALFLSVPLLFILLARYIQGFHIVGLPGVYAALVFVGYYVPVLFLLLTCVFAVLTVWTRLGVATSASVLALALFYLIVDATVYRIYRFHIDAFSLEYAIATFSGIGLSAGTLALAGALLTAAGVVVWLLFRAAARVPFRGRLAVAMTAISLLAFVASQAVHIVAYERNDSRITNITPRLPLYFPFRSRGKR